VPQEIQRGIAIRNAAPDMIFIIDSAGRYTGFSSGNTLRPLVPPELFIGRTVSQVMPVEVARTSMEAIHAALATQELQVVTYELWEGDAFRQYQCRIAPAGSDEVVALVRDQSADLFHQTRQERLRERERLETRAEAALLGENLYGLSFREFTVLVLIEQGFDDREIPRKLGLPRARISQHVASLLTKMGVQSRTAAAVLAIKLDLIPDSL
jgi:DNA-binding NarL/FixJ family response regulator